MASRKNDSPQKAAMREMMQGYLKDNDITIKSGNDINSIMRDMMSVLLEEALDEEPNEELGYSKYNYRNKETANSRNGHSKKIHEPNYCVLYQKEPFISFPSISIHIAFFCSTCPSSISGRMIDFITSSGACACSRSLITFLRISPIHSEA